VEKSAAGARKWSRAHADDQVASLAAIISLQRAHAVGAGTQRGRVLQHGVRVGASHAAVHAASCFMLLRASSSSCSGRHRRQRPCRWAGRRAACRSRPRRRRRRSRKWSRRCRLGRLRGLAGAGAAAGGRRAATGWRRCCTPRTPSPLHDGVQRGR
jgi:hypothetical protein